MSLSCLHALACPLCGQPLHADDRSLHCATGHAFDLARHGYVNLTLPGTHTGTADTPEMVAARQAFLAAGHFAPLRSAVADTVAEAAAGVEGCIIDAGGGTGEYLADALDMLPDREGLVLDLSKHACRRAARLHPRMSAVVADTWSHLPLADGTAAVLMNVFAPRNAAEFARVLAPGGALVVVTPTPAHLGELVTALGLVTVDAEKDERLDAQLSPHFALAHSATVTRTLALSADDAALAVTMGPSARHRPAEDVRRELVALGEPIAVTLSASISVWRKRA